jgi:hypothetical protein
MTNLLKIETRRNEAAAKAAKQLRRRDAALRVLMREEVKLGAAQRALARAERRLAKAQAEPQDCPVAAAPPAPAPVPPAPAAPSQEPPRALQTVAEGIPGFLDRRTPRTPEAEQLAAEIEGKRVAKSRARIATLKADRAGERKRMPLEGKAALAAIRGG